MTPQTLTLTAPADFLSKNYLWHIFGSDILLYLKCVFFFGQLILKTKFYVCNLFWLQFRSGPPATGLRKPKSPKVPGKVLGRVPGKGGLLAGLLGTVPFLCFSPQNPSSQHCSQQSPQQAPLSRHSAQHSPKHFQSHLELLVLSSERLRNNGGPVLALRLRLAVQHSQRERLPMIWPW